MILPKRKKNWTKIMSLNKKQFINLNQTSSNYEQIKDSYEKTDNAIENLKSR